MSTPDISASRFVSQTLVTDTAVHEVVGRTAKTITIRDTREGRVMRAFGPHSTVIATEALSDPDAKTRVLRLRADGTFRTASWANPLRPASTVDGVPVSVRDWSF